MIFVFDSETALLALHADAPAALSGRPSAELRDQRWLFFAADGEPLRVDCLADGSCQLRPWASCASCRLDQVLPFVASFTGTAACPDLMALQSLLQGRGG